MKALARHGILKKERNEQKVRSTREETPKIRLNLLLIKHSITFYLLLPFVCYYNRLWFHFRKHTILRPCCHLGILCFYDECDASTSPLLV